MDDLMIKVENISKEYKLGQIGGTTLRDELQRRHAKRRGLEDPTRMIGARDFEDGETFLALDGLSFEVKPGERVGIIGHNGAGKSTLLKLLCRVTAPTDGTIGLNGRIASMLEVGTGFHPELTGRENIYMNGAILGMTKKEIDRKIEDIIDFSEVRQFIDTPVKRYSSGMYVKLAFSVAAHLDSEIMIMDEVLAVGDMAFQKKCLDKMNDVSKTEGRTILYVSHNMNTIRQLCDRVIVLDHGHIVFDGGVEAGIAVYMGGHGGVSFHYLYTDEFHRNKNAIGGLRIEELSFLNATNGLFKPGDTFEVELRCSVSNRIENLLFRAVVSRGDGVQIGTMISEKPLTFPVGDSLLLRIRFHLEHIVCGHLRVDFIAFIFNDAGIEQVIDGVYPAFYFEVENLLTEEQPFRWLPQYWGNVKLENMEIRYEELS